MYYYDCCYYSSSPWSKVHAWRAARSSSPRGVARRWLRPAPSCLRPGDARRRTSNHILYTYWS